MARESKLKLKLKLQLAPEVGPHQLHALLLRDASPAAHHQHPPRVAVADGRGRHNCPQCVRWEGELAGALTAALAAALAAALTAL